MSQAKILAFAGSSRSGSVNRKAVEIAARGARNAGAEVTVVDLRECDLPLYDGDLEASEGLPAGALRLKELFHEHGGLLIACPEYNSSITPLLKNAIDWVSRPAKDRPELKPFANKVAGLIAASPGALGGLRGLYHVRDILQNMQVMVLGNMRALPKAGEAFDNAGELIDEKTRQGIESVGADLARTVMKLQD